MLARPPDGGSQRGRLGPDRRSGDLAATQTRPLPPPLSERVEDLGDGAQGRHAEPANQPRTAPSQRRRLDLLTFRTVVLDSPDEPLILAQDLREAPWFSGV